MVVKLLTLVRSVVGSVWFYLQYFSLLRGESLLSLWRSNYTGKVQPDTKSKLGLQMSRMLYV
jgi:hypothetical protein